MTDIKAKWIAADWGTTHMRAWAIGDNDSVLAYRESNEGMKDLQQNEFEPVLLRLIENWLDDNKVTNVMACGTLAPWQPYYLFDWPSDAVPDALPGLRHDPERRK